GRKYHSGEIGEEISGENCSVGEGVTDKGEYEADTVVIAVGLRPNTQCLDGILARNERGFVEVNEHMQSTSNPDIYVAGDATLLPFAPTGEKRAIALASNARRQGVIAA